MTWLLIDTHAAHRVRTAWLSSETKPEEKVFDARASELLPKLARNWKKRAKNLSGIVLVVGPGSFTSVRTGAVSANLIARWLKVPLYPLSVEESLDLAAVTARLAQGEVAPTGYAAPVYSAEPNITFPKAT